jgi:hypothetical protein
LDCPVKIPNALRFTLPVFPSGSTRMLLTG